MQIYPYLILISSFILSRMRLEYVTYDFFYRIKSNVRDMVLYYCGVGIFFSTSNSSVFFK